MGYGGFHFDLVSAWKARRLAHALRQRHHAVVGNVSLPSSGNLTSLPEVVRSYTSPLGRLAEEGIPLGDVRADVQEFGLLAMLAQNDGGSLPLLSMGEEVGAVPLLPPQGLRA